MKILYIHVGSPKTGTSAFQGYMYMNSAFLAANNISYFNELTPNEQSNHWYLAYKLKQYSTQPDLPYIEQVAEYIARTPQDIGFLSAEALSFWIKWEEGFELFISKLKESGIECRIVAVIRNPLDYLISAYGEDVVGGNCPLDFAEWLKSSQGVGHLGLLWHINHWAKFIDSRNFYWIAYEGREDFPRRILEYVTGPLQTQETILEYQPYQANASKSGTEIELYRRLNKCIHPTYSSTSRPIRIAEITNYIHDNLQPWELEAGHPRTFKLKRTVLPVLKEKINAMVQEANTLPFLNANAPFKVSTADQILARLQEKLSYRADIVLREEKRIAGQYKKMKYVHWLYTTFKRPSPYQDEAILHIKNRHQ